MDTELCTIPPLGVPALCSVCSTHKLEKHMSYWEQPARKCCSFFHRFWRSPVSYRHSLSQPHETYIEQENHPMPTLSIWAEKKVPCSCLCIGNSPGFRKHWVAISVTALVLSGFHPHQSVVLYICSVPFQPPELAWERKWTAEWMCSLDWNSKQHNFPSTHTLSGTSEQQHWHFKYHCWLLRSHWNEWST